jgi:hypothetical protein
MVLALSLAGSNLPTAGWFISKTVSYSWTADGISSSRQVLGFTGDKL